MKITSVVLPDALTDRIDQVARDSERSRSFVVRKLLEQSLTGEDRLRALQAVHDSNVPEPAEPPGPHGGELVAAASRENSKSVLNAHEKIARKGKAA